MVGYGWGWSFGLCGVVGIGHNYITSVLQLLTLPKMHLKNKPQQPHQTPYLYRIHSPPSHPIHPSPPDPKQLSATTTNSINNDTHINIQKKDKIKTKTSPQSSMLINSKSFPNILSNINNNGYIKINNVKEGYLYDVNGNMVGWGVGDGMRKFQRTGKGKTFNVGGQNQWKAKNCATQPIQGQEKKNQYKRDGKLGKQAKEIKQVKESNLQVRRGKFMRRNTLNIDIQDQLIRSNSIAAIIPSPSTQPLKQHLLTQSTKIQTLQSKLSSSTTKITELENKITSLQQRIKALTQQLTQKEQSIQNLSHIITTHEQDKKSMSKKLQEIMKEQELVKGNNIGQNCGRGGSCGGNGGSDEIYVNQFGDFAGLDSSCIGDLMSTAEYLESLADLEEELHNKKTQIFDLNKVIEQLKMKQHFTQLRHEQAIKRNSEQWNTKYKKLLQMYKTLKDRQYHGTPQSPNQRMKKPKPPTTQQKPYQYSSIITSLSPSPSSSPSQTIGNRNKKQTSILNRNPINQYNLRLEQIAVIEDKKGMQYYGNGNGNGNGSRVEVEELFNLSLSTDRGQISGCF